MNRIRGLDGLRALAFFLVFATHARFGSFGWIGLQFFFVLSGFLITGIVLEMKASLPLWEYFSKFYGRRFLRIFPLYYLYLALCAGLVLGLLHAGIRRPALPLFWAHIPYALTYTYNFFMATSLFTRDSALITHLWSMSMEEQFYVLWPMLILLTPGRRLAKTILFVILLGPLFRLGTLLFYQNQPWFDFLGQTPETAVYVLPFSHWDAFAMGALLLYLPHIPRARAQFLLLLIAIPGLGMLSDFLSTGQWNLDNGYGLRLLLPHAYKCVWGYSALNYFFMLLIHGVMREDWFLRLVEQPALRYLGKISYGLYVYHFPILWLLAVIFFPRLSPLPIALMGLPATILAASLSYRFVEKPISDLKDRWFPVRVQPAIPATPESYDIIRPLS